MRFVHRRRLDGSLFYELDLLRYVHIGAATLSETGASKGPRGAREGARRTRRPESNLGLKPTDTLDAPTQVLYDIAIRNQIVLTYLKQAALTPSGAVESAYVDKLKTFDSSLRAAFNLTQDSTFPKLGFHIIFARCRLPCRAL